MLEAEENEELRAQRASRALGFPILSSLLGLAMQAVKGFSGIIISRVVFLVSFVCNFVTQRFENSSD